MNSFKDFGIQPSVKKFVGDKIKIKKVLNVEIVIHHFNIGPSDFPDKGNGKRLDIQIEMDGTKYLLWTGSVQLQDMMLQVSETGFPFTTIIKEDGESYKFT